MVYIKEPLLREMIINAESTAEECCGFLFGYETSEYRTLTNAMFTMNVAPGDKRTNFEIAPKDYRKAEQFAVQNNLNLLGIYHSHPNHPASPSAFDKVAAQPYFSYVILSVLNKKFSTIRSWRLNDDLQFAEEKSVITK